MPAHNEERSRRTVLEESERRTYTVTSTGEQITLASGGRSYTQTERWCGYCQKWVVCNGIIGHVATPCCRESWHTPPGRPVQ